MTNNLQTNITALFEELEQNDKALTITNQEQIEASARSLQQHNENFEYNKAKANVIAQLLTKSQTDQSIQAITTLQGNLDQLKSTVSEVQQTVTLVQANQASLTNQISTNSQHIAIVGTHLRNVQKTQQNLSIVSANHQKQIDAISSQQNDFLTQLANKTLSSNTDSSVTQSTLKSCALVSEKYLTEIRTFEDVRKVYDISCDIETGFYQYQATDESDEITINTLELCNQHLSGINGLCNDLFTA